MFHYLDELDHHLQQAIARQVDLAGGNVLLLVHPRYKFDTKDEEENRIRRILEAYKNTGRDLVALEAEIRSRSAEYLAGIKLVLSDKGFTVVIVFEAVEDHAEKLKLVRAWLKSVDEKSPLFAQLTRVSQESPPKESSTELLIRRVANLQSMDPTGRPLLVVPTYPMNPQPYKATWEETIETMRELRVRHIHLGGSDCVLDHRGAIIPSGPDVSPENFGCVNEAFAQLKGKFQSITLILDATDFHMMPRPESDIT